VTIRFTTSNFFHALFFAVGILIPQGVIAQTVMDPTTAEFDPSADHSASNSGTVVVSRYDLEFYFEGAAQPFQTLSVGKPDPQQDGKIRVNLASLFGALPSPGVVYESAVAAVGPGGTARSARSNAFMWSTSCVYSVSPTNASIAANGSSGSITVTTSAGCAWAATESSTWITITSGGSGSGSGTVSYTVAANTSSSARSATMQVAGQSVTISQSGGCNYSVSPTSLSLAAGAGSTSVSVSTGNGCSWTASDNRSWISVSSGSSGSGNGTVVIAVTANPNSSLRSGTVTVAGQSIAVTQAGASACSESVSPTSQTIDAGGGTATFAVSTSSGCGWTSTESIPWLSITSGASGSGNGSVTFLAESNTTNKDRTASVSVAGQLVSLTQSRLTGPSAPKGVRVVGRGWGKGGSK